MVFEQIAEAVVITNQSGRIMLANPAFAHLVGSSAEALRGEYLDRFLTTHDDQLRPVARPTWNAMAQPDWRGEVWLHGPYGQPVPAWLSYTSTGESAKHPIGHPIVACFTDLSVQHAQQQALWDQAHRDRITNLPNFRSLEERAGDKLGDHETGLLMVFYMGGLGDIAGAHGHPVAEQILRRLAARLQTQFFEDGHTYFLDSNEFGVLLPRISEEQALKRAGSAVTSLMEPVLIDDISFHIKPYAGLCAFPDGGNSASDLIRHARLAVDLARRSGSPCVRSFDLQDDANLKARLELDTQLAHALERGEFRLVYQPQVELENGDCIGAEALLRWNNPVLGEVSPVRFIPVAEASGLMLSIGRWVLDEACRQMRAWQDEGLLCTPIAVNVSAPQLLEDNLPLAVAEALEKHQLDPRWLEIELTESLLLTDSHRAKAAIDQLADLGVGLALDDFGTGYASFSYLQRFQFHRLKIDRSLVQYVTDRPRDAAIVGAIAGMGRALDMEILVEGIETSEQAQALRASGCVVAQGFLYARPLAAADAGRWIKQHTSKKD
jgi:predicted signal transduction protein with EAL and GGDEF domain